MNESRKPGASDMNRSERRAAARKVKGGCGGSGITIHFGPQKEPNYTPALDCAVKAGKDYKTARTLRSKQVPGY